MFEGPQCQNGWAHAPPRRRPHLGPFLPPAPHSWQIGPAGFLGLAITLCRSPRGPSQGAWSSNAGDWGPLIHHRTQPAAPPPPGALVAPPVIQGGRKGTALRGFNDLQKPTSQNAWADAPARQRPHLGPPSARRTAGRSGLPASWGLTLTLCRPPRIHSQGAWRSNPRDWGTPSPKAGLTLLTGCHPGR